jgi:hypothetical protein
VWIKIRPPLKIETTATLPGKLCHKSCKAYRQVLREINGGRYAGRTINWQKSRIDSGLCNRRKREDDVNVIEARVAEMFLLNLVKKKPTPNFRRHRYAFADIAFLSVHHSA